MKALIHLLRWDLVMQVRYGFWAAGTAISIVWAGLFWPLSTATLNVWLPFVLYSDIASIGMMFVAGALFFDRRQGVIEALAVTPVPTSVWLLSKLITLTVLGTTVASAIVVLLYGVGVAWGRLLLAFGLSSCVFTMIGFLVAARFGTVSSFLVFFGLISIPTALPVLDYFDVWSHPAIWLLPFQPALVALREAFHPADTTTFALALGLLVVWIGVGFPVCVATFHRHVSGRQGVA